LTRRVLYEASGLPIFQNKMYSSQEDALNCPVGEIRLVQDDKTGLIFNEAFNPSLLEYDQDYQNEQAHSGVFQKHLADVKGIIDRHFQTREAVEVGCGKGYFLEYLNQQGYRITGVDPAYEGSNPDVIRGCFDQSLGIASKNIILRHVLEHVQDPFAFLNTIARANGGNGKIYIEVPCLDWICEHRAWFDIFYEHVNYFRISDFRRIFKTIHETGHVFGGQYLYVVGDLASLQPPVAGAADRFELPSDFLAGIDRVSINNGKARKAVWGGASKGVIFTLMMQRKGLEVDYLIDINPAKQGKFVGVSGLKVTSPEEAMRGLGDADEIYVMNSNYREEIIAMSGNRFNYITVD
jgi:SAM-dependent methyltransferase